MNPTKLSQQRQLRKRRVRAKIFGTSDKPRLSIFRSNKNIYAQLIDDEKGITLASLFMKKESAPDKSKSELARETGRKLAEAAKQLNITRVIFDRGQYKYHGRIQALAEGAREAGLSF